MPNIALQDLTIQIDVTTTTNAVQTISLGTLNADGDSISFQVHLIGMQNNGERMARILADGNSARNATGNNTVTPVLIGPTGSTDTAAVPWTASAGLPTNWGLALGLSGNQLQLTFNADNAQTVIWKGFITRQLYGTASST